MMGLPIRKEGRPFEKEVCLVRWHAFVTLTPEQWSKMISYKKYMVY